MPVNLVSARGVVRYYYFNPTLLKLHQQTLYFGNPIINDGGALRVFDTVNPATSLSWTVVDVISSIWFRADIDLTLTMPPIALGLIQAWNNDLEGEEETFVGFDVTDLPDLTDLTGTANAACMLSWNFQSANRRNFRLQFYDTADATPHRYPGVNPPDIDDGSLDWFMLKSSVPFVTNDNFPLTRWVGTTQGYNRALKRKYGNSLPLT